MSVKPGDVAKWAAEAASTSVKDLVEKAKVAKSQCANWTAEVENAVEPAFWETVTFGLYSVSREAKIAAAGPELRKSIEAQEEWCERYRIYKLEVDRRKAAPGGAAEVEAAEVEVGKEATAARERRTESAPLPAEQSYLERAAGFVGLGTAQSFGDRASGLLRLLALVALVGAVGYAAVKLLGLAIGTQVTLADKAAELAPRVKGFL